MTFSESTRLLFISLSILSALMPILVGIFLLRKTQELYHHSRPVLTMGISLVFGILIASLGIWLTMQLNGLKASLYLGSWICMSGIFIFQVGMLSFFVFGERLMKGYTKQI